MPISTSNYLGDQPDAQPGHARPSAEDLRDAFARNEFTLADQPIVPATTGAITGCEALLRWHHPTSGPVSPGGLVPLAEQAVLIDDARATLDGITAIRALGLSVALDDVGAGCSSPGYLQGFALDGSRSIAPSSGTRANQPRARSPSARCAPSPGGSG